jgi:hypothetical protein
MKVRFFERLSMFALLICMSLLCAVGARAQETGDIVGTVTDSTGAVVPNATVTLTNTATNVSQTAQSGGDGNYLFTFLQVGNYVVKVQAAGFKTATHPEFALSSGDRARADIKLEVGEQTTTVEVQATVAPALQTDSSNVGQLTSSQTVEALPLNGRNLIQLVYLAPGVTAGSPGSIVQGNRPDDRRLVSSFSVNGQTDTMNNNMIDGMDNNERIIGTIGVRPSIDAVQEVNVQTNKYDASVGRTGGGVVDVITKAGTNNLHGSAYEFFRNRVLNTNPNWAFTGTSAPNPQFQQNQFGGSIGGPIVKNKTFFFFDYEGLNFNTGLAASQLSVPTYCEKGLITCPDGLKQFGDFSDIQTVSPITGGTVLGGPGPSGVGLLPLCAGNVQTQANAGTCLSAVGKAYFNMYPLPTCGPGTSATCSTGPASGINAGTVNNYTASPVKRFKSDTYDARVDQHFNDKNTLFGRYTHNGETTNNPNGFPNVNIDPATGNLSSSGLLITPVVTQYAGPNNEVQNNLAFSYVHVYNPNLLLNLKAGVFRSAIISLPANNKTDITNKLGIPCTATACVNAESLTPGIVGSGLSTVTLAAINGSNTYSGIGDTSFIPLLEFDTSFQYMGTLTWNRGAHSVRVGLSLIRRRATIGQSNNPQGTFTFNGSYTGVALGDLLEGLDATLSRNNALDQPGFRTWEPGIYLQDDWRARPWLTLNLGIRYDIFTPYTEVHGRMSNYNPYTGLVQSPAIPGIQQSGPTAGVPTPLRDFAPRFGFAATLKHNMVLRGGFGLTYFPVNYESPYYMKNAPFGYSASCTIQNNSNTNTPCNTAQFDGAAGQFSNGLNSKYGANNSTGTFNKPGGALFGLGLPTPVLNIALATNTANYKTNGVIGSVPVNLQENYLEQWNLVLQKQFGANVVNLGYVGQRGVHVAPLNSATNQNLPANPTENTPTTLPMVVGGNSYAFGPLAGYPYFNATSTGASEEANIGTSQYHALQASLVRRFSHGLTVNFNYVWSHMTDNVDGNRSCVLSIFATPQPCWYDQAKGAGPVVATVNPGPPVTTTYSPFFNTTSPTSACATAGAAVCKQVFGWQQGDWGNGTQDVADRFSWGMNYQVPFGSSLTGIEGGLLKGWGVNLCGSWQTGIPFSVTTSTNSTGLSGSGYADQTCSGRLGNPTRLHWFDYNCFVQPTMGLLGSQHPNQLFGPPQRSLSASLSKEFPIKEQLKLQFRAEVFNVFNTSNYGQPASALSYLTPAGGVPNSGAVSFAGSASTTAQITSMNANWNPRQIQLALKLVF